MIVKNEESVLERCLKHAHLCFDEIIIVDTGSTDNTKQIASKFTDKIFDFVWVNDFSKARNFAFSKASKDLVMWLDADDVLEENEAIKIRELANNFPDNVSSVRMLYYIDFDKFDNPTFSYYRERLFKRNANPIWIEPIHEYVFCAGNTIYKDIIIKHKKEKITDKNRNIKIFNSLKKAGIPFSARMQYYYARELSYHNQPKKTIKEFQKFLKLENGWNTNKAEACLEMSNCYLTLNDKENALKVLFDSFLYALPTAEALCKIAKIYQDDENIKKAIYWYNLALEKSTPLESGFVQKDYYNYIPAINLCVLYYKLKDYQKSEFYNNIAGNFKPFDDAYLYNKKFFQFLNLKKHSKLKNKNKFKRNISRN